MKSIGVFGALGALFSGFSVLFPIGGVYRIKPKMPKKVHPSTKSAPKQGDMNI
jgi:hypothetical protein